MIDEETAIRCDISERFKAAAVHLIAAIALIDKHYPGYIGSGPYRFLEETRNRVESLQSLWKRPKEDETD